MNSEEILQALSLLDPNDDSHWTKEGQPLLHLIGENVSRAQVVAAAPKFNRKNPSVQPDPAEPAPPAEPSIEEVQAKIDAERKAAEADLAALNKQLAALQEQIKQKTHQIQKLEISFRKADTRSDTEINQEFLKADFESRLKKAEQRELAAALLAQAGVSGRDISMYKLGPADRAIAAANINKRKQALNSK